MNSLLFEENQSFRQTWLWALMLAVLGIIFVAMFLALEQGADPFLLVVLFPFAAVCLLLFLLKLSVEVDQDFIHLRFFPLVRKAIPVKDVVRFEARTYRPILEYGGWGIRYSWSKGWAYNVSGNQGVQLELANGKHILIGSQRAEELAKAIGEAKGRG